MRSTTPAAGPGYTSCPPRPVSFSPRQRGERLLPDASESASAASGKRPSPSTSEAPTQSAHKPYRRRAHRLGIGSVQVNSPPHPCSYAYTNRSKSSPLTNRPHRSPRSARAQSDWPPIPAGNRRACLPSPLFPKRLFSTFGVGAIRRSRNVSLPTNERRARETRFCRLPRDSREL